MSSSMWSAFESSAPSVMMMTSGSGAATAAMSSVDPAQLLNSQLASALSTMGSDSVYWEESISPTQIRQQLNDCDPSNPQHTSQMLRGMKWLLASISKGRDVSDFYPQVVKLVAADHSLEVRKMVYMYLVQYADYDSTTRELSLLSINSFQRGLADAEALIRALALRVLTSIQLAEIVQIQILAIQKSTRDKSPYVRKCAANAIAKLYERCNNNDTGDDTKEQKEMLLESLRELITADDCTMVLTSALIAFQELCPERLELLHGSFRKVCHLLTDMDEWGQIIVIELLQRYCRRFFKEPYAHKHGSAEQIDKQRRVYRTLDGINKTSPVQTIDLGTTTAASTAVTLPPRQAASSTRKKVKRRVVKKGFYSDEEDESTEEEVYADTLTGEVLPSLSAAMREQNVNHGFSDGIPTSITTSANGADMQTSGSDSAVTDQEESDLAPDHLLLLRSAAPLLKSRNPGVVLAVCSLQYYCGISSIKVRAAMGKALVRIHHIDRSREVQYAVLSSIRTLAAQCPSAFAPFLHDFFIKATDPPFTRIIKLDILTTLALEPSSIRVVLSELRNYVRHRDRRFCCAAIRAVGRVVEMARIVYDRHASGVRESGGDTDGHVMDHDRTEANRIALDCLHGLLVLSQTSEKSVIVGEAVVVSQWILQLLLSDSEGVNGMIKDKHSIRSHSLRRIMLLVSSTLSLRVTNEDNDDGNGDDESEEYEEPERSRLQKVAQVKLPPRAVAAGLWILGEVLSSPLTSEPAGLLNLDQDTMYRIRAEIVRLIARAFPVLDAVEKEQAIHFVSKILVARASNSGATSPGEDSLCEHVLSMGRVDVNTDVRDRGRFESTLLRMTVGLHHDMDALDDMPIAGQQSSLSTEEAKRILLSRKPASSSLPLEDERNSGSNDGSDGFRFGTLSSLVGHKARSAYTRLPPWATENSPSSLRDPVEKVERNIDGGKEISGSSGADGFYGEDSDHSSSSSSSDESSSDSGYGGSSGGSSSSSDDDSSSEDSSNVGANNNDLLQMLPQSQNQRETHRQNPPMSRSSPLVSQSAQVQTAGKHDSSSDDSSSSSSSSSSEPSYSSSDGNRPDATLLPTMGSNFGAASAFPSSTTGTSSISDDLRGLVLAPVTVDASDAPNADPNIERDSSSWIQLVRPDHANGLSVKGRYLRGVTKAREAQLLGIPADASKADLVCMQIRFENVKTDGNSFRRLRIAQKASSSSASTIVPKRVVAPPEIAQLSKGQQVDCVIGIEFSGISDREGSLLAKVDVKFGSGGIPVDIKPSLSDVLLPPLNNKRYSVDEFDSAIGRLRGFQRVETTLMAPRSQLPVLLMQAVALTPVGSNSAKWKGDKLRLVGILPASSDPVFVQVTCKDSSSSDPAKAQVTVCCDHALAANCIVNHIKRSIPGK